MNNFSVVWRHKTQQNNKTFIAFSVCCIIWLDVLYGPEGELLMAAY